MGDSFSSGEGTEPYLYGTDIDNYNTCHRSTEAYPLMLEAETSLNIGQAAFVACSGAKIEHIVNAANSDNLEPPQVAKISEDTTLVTMSIGGNDVGFGTVMRECVMKHEIEPGFTQTETDQRKCAAALSDAEDVLESGTFVNDLTEVYEDVTSLGNEDTKFIILAYPQIFPDYENVTETCTWGTGAFGITSGREISESEISSIRNLTTQFNTLADGLVDELDDSNVRFKDPSPMFETHELCTSNSPHFNFVKEVVDPIYQSASFHPNSSGQFDYFVTIDAALLNWNL